MKREQAFDNEIRAPQKAFTSNGRLLNQRSWANVVKEQARPMTNQNSQVENGAVKKLATANKAPVEFSKWKIKGLGSWDFLPKANGSFRPKNDFPLRRMKQRNFHEFMQAKQDGKDWKKAVIMFRDNSGLSWSCIFYNLSRELGRKLQVSQMFDDRTIIWCRDENEVVYFLEKGIWSIPGTGDTKVSFKRWSVEEQNRDIKVECRGSWIGVKGLPLNIWNMKVFRKIGDLCGGLLDVEKDTAEMNFLHHLRIKLEGDNNDFEIGRRIEGERDSGHHDEVGEEERNQELGRVSGVDCSLEVEPEGSDEISGGVDFETVGWDTNDIDCNKEAETNLHEKLLVVKSVAMVTGDGVENSVNPGNMVIGALTGKDSTGRVDFVGFDTDTMPKEPLPTSSLKSSVASVRSL
uniref:DUF4283 domain-containing protein n=1 Tax=Cannabis sativa TaxID=3483 RepID=A0A803PX19_CANSA